MGLLFGVVFGFTFGHTQVGGVMDKFDEHEICPACGNDPVESGLKWKPKFIKGEMLDKHRWATPPHLLASCGQCRYQLERACLNEV